MFLGNRKIAYIGAEAYLNARKRTKDIEAVLTNSGESGTLKDALYYSFIAVRGEDADKYRSGNGFDLKRLKVINRICYKQFYIWI